MFEIKSKTVLYCTTSDLKIRWFLNNVSLNEMHSCQTALLFWNGTEQQLWQPNLFETSLVEHCRNGY